MNGCVRSVDDALLISPTEFVDFFVQGSASLASDEVAAALNHREKVRCH